MRFRNTLTVVGLINFTDKTITIRGVPKYSNTSKDITIHELCHYIDRLWNNESNTDKLKSLYEQYQNGSYITHAYAGITITEDYQSDILYATSNRQEFFAEAMKDYLLHPDYLKDNYSDIYDYFRLLFIKKGWNR